MVFDGLQAVFELGLPVAGLTWLLFYRLYSRGEIDRAADRKAIRTNLKQIKKASKESRGRGGSVLHNKWMKFGGGFYGVAALWTFIVIEATDLVTTVAGFQGFDAMFEDGILGFIIHAVVNQITNFVNALVWFGYWAGGDTEHSLILWVAIAYAAYVAGLNLARREVAAVTEILEADWRQWLRRRFARKQAGSGR